MLHMGDADAGLSPVFEALEKSMIPIKIFRPTHVNRRKGLLEEGYQLLERVDTSISPVASVRTFVRADAF